MSPLPISVLITQTAVTHRQNIIHRSLPHFGAIRQKQPLRLLSTSHQLFCYSFFNGNITRESFLQKQMWKHNLAEVDITLRELQNASSHKVFSNLRLLRSAKESDFIYLPIQISHFQTIQRFMPVER